MAMLTYSIAITTFAQRFKPYLEPLISSIKALRPEIEILVMVNGPVKGALNDVYRQQILHFLANQQNSLPTLFPNFQGLAKLWNRGVLTASNEYVLVLNDDLAIDTSASSHFFDNLEALLLNRPKTFKINGSFSHFVIKKSELIEVGFFDERLLGIGEEDGDFVWRYHETYGSDITSIDLSGINNIQSTVADEGFSKGVGHYSKFNRYFIKHEKYQEVMIGGYKGMFDKRSKKKLADAAQYPYEDFYLKNRDKL
jgi:hypothetical protein